MSKSPRSYAWICVPITPSPISKSIIWLPYTTLKFVFLAVFSLTYGARRKETPAFTIHWAHILSWLGHENIFAQSVLCTIKQVKLRYLLQSDTGFANESLKKNFNELLNHVKKPAMHSGLFSVVNSTITTIISNVISRPTMTESILTSTTIKAPAQKPSNKMEALTKSTYLLLDITKKSEMHYSLKTDGFHKAEIDLFDIWQKSRPGMIYQKAPLLGLQSIT